MSRTLEQAAAAASACTLCRLAEGRTTVVFGSGNPAADLMLVGEAPGRNEDLEGEPFVGAAGRLLTTLLGEAGIERSDVYIANVLKCRPPGNRDPLPDEIEACKPFLKEQIALVDPAVICTLGNFATRLLLGRTVGITRVRGHRFAWRGRILVPMLHPAAILRGGPGGAGMADMRADIRLVAKTLAGARAPETGPSEASEHAENAAEQLGLFS